MNAWPLIKSRLSLAARWRWMWLLRLGPPMIASFVMLSFLASQSPLLPVGQVGQLALGNLLFYLIPMFLLAGPVLVTTSLSQERREGTLHLLLLTRLSPSGILTGKFFGLTLPAWQVLGATFPIISLSVFWGGVSPFQAAGAGMMIAAAFLVSVAISLLASALARDEAQSLLLATIGLTGYVLLPLLIDWWRFGHDPQLHNSIIGCFSLMYPGFAYTRPLLGAEFIGLGQLACCHALMAGLCLVLASHLLSRRSGLFQNGAVRDPSTGFSSVGRLPRPPRRFAQDNVINFIVRANWPRLDLMIWSVTLVSITLFVTAEIKGVDYHFLGNYWANPLEPVRLPLKLLYGFVAWRVFAGAKHADLLALVACTPLRFEELLTHYWQAVRRLFALPFCLIAMAQVATLSLTWNPLEQSLMVLYLAVVNLVEFFAIGWTAVWLACCPTAPTWRWLRGICAIGLLTLNLLFVGGLLLEAIVWLLARQRVRDDLERWVKETVVRHRSAPAFNLAQTLKAVFPDFNWPGWRVLLRRI